MFKNLRFRRRLRKIGTSVDIAYLLYLNNQDPIHFPSQSDCFDYIKKYRSENEIFSIQIYRIETFSL